MDDVLRRGGDVATAVNAWKSVDEQRKKLQAQLDGARQQRNAANEKMAKLDKKSAEFAAARDELKALSGRIKDGEKVAISAGKQGLTFNGKLAEAA